MSYNNLRDYDSQIIARVSELQELIDKLQQPDGNIEDIKLDGGSP